MIAVFVNSYQHTQTFIMFSFKFQNGVCKLKKLNAKFIVLNKTPQKITNCTAIKRINEIYVINLLQNPINKITSSSIFHSKLFKSNLLHHKNFMKTNYCF